MKTFVLWIATAWLTLSTFAQANCLTRLLALTESAVPGASGSLHWQGEVMAFGTGSSAILYGNSPGIGVDFRGEALQMIPPLPLSGTLFAPDRISVHVLPDNYFAEVMPRQLLATSEDNQVEVYFLHADYRELKSSSPTGKPRVSHEPEFQAQLAGTLRFPDAIVDIAAASGNVRAGGEEIPVPIVFAATKAVIYPLVLRRNQAPSELPAPIEVKGDIQCLAFYSGTKNTKPSLAVATAGNLQFFEWTPQGLVPTLGGPAAGLRSYQWTPYGPTPSSSRVEYTGVETMQFVKGRDRTWLLTTSKNDFGLNVLRVSTFDPNAGLSPIKDLDLLGPASALIPLEDGNTVRILSRRGASFLLRLTGTHGPSIEPDDIYPAKPQQ